MVGSSSRSGPHLRKWVRPFACLGFILDLITKPKQALQQATMKTGTAKRIDIDTMTKNPTKQRCGALGGAIRNEAKAVASRLNGCKGGRPKKKDQPCKQLTESNAT